MNRATLTTEVRSLLNEPNTSFFANTEIYRWLNRGCEIVVSRTEAVEDNYSFSSVKYQKEYDLPGRCIKTKAIFWEDDKLEQIDWRQYLSYTAKSDHTNIGQPKEYVPWNNKVYLHPAPSSSSTVTAADGTQTSTVTTLLVVSTDGFPSMGRAISGSEVFSYTNTDATNFRGVTRGSESTTAASLKDGVSVTERDISLLMYSRQATLSATISPTFSVNYHMLPVYYAASMGFRKQGQLDKAREWNQMFEAGINEMKKELKNKTRDKLPSVKNETFYGEGGLGMT